MLLSHDAIIEHKKKGSIIIEPFSHENLKTASYDVTLGPWFWREGHPSGRSAVHNLYDEDSTKKVWGGPYEAESVLAFEEHTGTRLKNVKPDDRVIFLAPKETILGHTLEFVGGKDIVVAKMYARSSLGRNFVEVCKDAGWGDVGYFNRWTMEITNNSQHYSIPLVVGRRIAQMVFYEVAPIKNVSMDYARDAGKYQESEDLEVLKKTWNPHMMIPRMHLDREVKEI